MKVYAGNPGRSSVRDYPAKYLGLDSHTRREENVNHIATLIFAVFFFFFFFFL